SPSAATLKIPPPPGLLRKIALVLLLREPRKAICPESLMGDVAVELELRSNPEKVGFPAIGARSPVAATLVIPPNGSASRTAWPGFCPIVLTRNTRCPLESI